MFEPAWERFVAREVLGIDPIKIPGGHFPMLEGPDALADLFDRLARTLPHTDLFLRASRTANAVPLRPAPDPPYWFERYRRK